MLPNSDVNPLLVAPSVGLGCASFGGPISVGESIRVLDAAFSAGVRYFDVARSYGFGQAESALGRFLGHIARDDVVVATKVGIRPPTGLRQSNAVRRMARLAAAASPGLRWRIRTAGGRSISQGVFALPDMASSFHRSLKDLSVDRVDVLHLHECRLEDVTDEVRGWAEQRVARGEAGTWGIATSAEEAVRIVEDAPVPVVQIPAPAGSPLPQTILAREGVLVRHSVVRTALAPLRRLLTDDVDRAHWERELDLRLDERDLAAFLLRVALSQHPPGPVLVGTTRPEHARAIAGAAPLESAQAAAATALVQASLARETV